jgi:hypothetical protein
MSELSIPPVLAEIIDGPVDPVDRVRAFDALRQLCRRAPQAVRRARARLFAGEAGVVPRAAIAEATLVLEGGAVVAAGAEAPTMAEAIDELATRLWCRLRSVPGLEADADGAHCQSGQALSWASVSEQISRRPGASTPSAGTR